MAGEAAGFWSYVRKDDDGDYGRIRSLADDLRDRYRIQTGDELELFVDRESILWGQAWQLRIDTAIAGTTFFIPIVTPSYFRSEACRHELLKFTREAERLGLTELLMSIYWVRVPELEVDPDESSDEAIRVVAKYGWEDLRDASLEDRDSAIYRKAVAALADELAKRAEATSTVDDVPHQEVVSVELGTWVDDEDGIIEKLAATEEAMPRAVKLLSEIGQQMEAINLMLEGTSKKLKEASNRGQGMKAALTLTNRLAQEIAAPASIIGDDGHEYGQVLGKLDAGIQVQLDIIEQQDELTEDNLATLRALLDLVENARETAVGLNGMLAEAETAATFSRSLRAPLGVMRSGLLGVLDGNGIIEEWGRRAVVLLGGNEPLDKSSASPADEEEPSGASGLEP